MNTVKLMEPRLLTVKEGNCKYGKGELRMDPMVLNWNWRNQWESSFPYTYIKTITKFTLITICCFLIIYSPIKFMFY